MKEQRKANWLNYVAPFLLLLLLLGAMEWYIKANNVPRWMIAAPTAIFQEFIKSFSKEILPNFAITLGEILTGYAVAVPFGVLMAILLTQFYTFGKAFAPYTIAVISTPLMILVPLLTIWLGLGFHVKVIAVTLQSFTIVMMNCTTGFNNIDPMMMELMKTVGASRWQRLKYVVLPSSLPNIFNGMRMSAISASTAAIATEFYSSTSGLGAKILHSSAYTKTELMFACIVMVAVTGLTLYLLPTAIEKLVIKWKI